MSTDTTPAEQPSTPQAEPEPPTAPEAEVPRRRERAPREGPVTPRRRTAGGVAAHGTASGAATLGSYAVHAMSSGAPGLGIGLLAGAGALGVGATAAYRRRSRARSGRTSAAAGSPGLGAARSPLASSGAAGRRRSRSPLARLAAGRGGSGARAGAPSGGGRAERDAARRRGLAGRLAGGSPRSAGAGGSSPGGRAERSGRRRSRLRRGLFGGGSGGAGGSSGTSRGGLLSRRRSRKQGAGAKAGKPSGGGASTTSAPKVSRRQARKNRRAAGGANGGASGAATNARNSTNQGSKRAKRRAARFAKKQAANGGNAKHAVQIANQRRRARIRFSTFLGRMWQRMIRRAAPTPETADEAIGETAPEITAATNATPPAEIPAARSVNIPKSTEEKAAMSTGSVHLDPVAEALDTHIGGFAPENATQIMAFLAGLNPMFETLAGSLARVADRIGADAPVDAAVTDHLGQMAASARTMGDWATETHKIFRLAHDKEIERIEQPRTGEHMWDVTKQD